MTVDLRPMTPAEYDAWRRPAVDDYARSFVDAGILTPADAAQRAAKDFDQLLGDGLDTADHSLFSAVVDGEVVGMLWLHFTTRARGLEAFVYDVAVDEAHRGRGYGRAIMEAGHEVCRRRGAVAVGLNVFGHNTVARRLYDSLGYRVTATNMKLDL